MQPPTPPEEIEYRRQERAKASRIQELQRDLSLAELRALPDDEVISRHDELRKLASEHWTLSPSDYEAELIRRRDERATMRLEFLTWVLVGLTASIVFLTIVLIVSD